jgi:hypothetical protein
MKVKHIIYLAILQQFQKWNCWGGSKGKEKATPALNVGKLRACVEIRR